MTRHTFGGCMADWAFVFNDDGTVGQAAGAVLTFWDSLAGGDQYPAAPMPGGVDDGTGLLDGTGAPISSVTCDGNGEIPDALQGPDGVYTMAADASGGGTGPRRWITANDMGGDLTALLIATAGLAALEAAPLSVYYDTTLAAYPVRPGTTAPVWWVGPVAPPAGGTGASEALGDEWLATSGGPAPDGVTSVAAGDASITIGGTPGAPTVETGSLDEIADNHPPAGPWSNNSQPIHHVANGTASDDVAAFGQIPVLTPTGPKTASYTPNPGEFVKVDTTSGAVPVPLPHAPADKTQIGVKLVTAGTGYACTVSTSGGDVFNVAGGGTTLTLSRKNQSFICQYEAATGIWDVPYSDSAIPFPAASVNLSPASPVGNSTSTLLMQGLGVAGAVITPAGSGKVEVTITGIYLTTVSAVNINLGGRYGTGTPPANGTAAAGTRFGTGSSESVLKESSASSGAGMDFELTAILTLTPGTAYWFDAVVSTQTGGDVATLENLNVKIKELVN